MKMKSVPNVKRFENPGDNPRKEAAKIDDKNTITYTK